MHRVRLKTRSAGVARCAGGSSRRAVLAIPLTYMLIPQRPAHSWTYDEAWEGVCREGREQSPIDLSFARNGPDATEGKEPTLHVKYPLGHVPGDVVDNGHGSPQINFKDENLCVECNGETFVLDQIHFHHPGEHTIDTQVFDMEAHLVHHNRDSASKNSILVLGVLLQRGDKRCEILDRAMDHVSSKSRAISSSSGDVGFALMSLFPTRGDYLFYKGSLTTPPCSENVSWLVGLEPVSITDGQLERFREFGSVRQNARVIQGSFEDRMNYHVRMIE